MTILLAPPAELYWDTVNNNKSGHFIQIRDVFLSPRFGVRNLLVESSDLCGGVLLNVVSRRYRHLSIQIVRRVCRTSHAM